MSATYEELEKLWRGRMLDARNRLSFTRNFLREIQADRRAGVTSPPDSEFVYQRALEADRRALAEYARVLQIFTDLVAHGELPSEEETKTRKAGSGDSG